MEDRNRNKGNRSYNQNWEQNRRQDEQYGQQSNANQGFMDLDGDGFIGNTGGFYGGTSYLGANYDDWMNNQNQGRSSDAYRDQGQQYRNQQDQYRGQQNYNQRGNYGNQHYQGMSGQGNNAQYGRGFDNYSSDYNRRQDEYRSQHPNFSSDSHYSQNSGWGTNHGQAQRAGANQYQPGYNNQDNDWNRSSNQYTQGNRGQHKSWIDRTADKISSWFSDDDDKVDRRFQRQSLLGPHRGKGPRGYQRSADRIREDIHDRLHDDPYIDASEVEVEINQNEVILKGYVDSRESKRRAEDLVESISGVRHVENRLRVGRPDTYGNTNYYHQHTGSRNHGTGTDDTEKDITV
jgi:osmotically-inducible protein OsmY